MNTPSIKCKIEVFCSINPSEDTKKVESAILNIFPECKIDNEKFSIRGYSENLNVLEKIHEVIHSMQYQRIYKRTLEKNLEKNTTWFYLNKQAAFAEKIAICGESDESPLGPMKIVLTSFNIDRIIEWLVFDE
ncbi:MAG: RNA-binding domain-containing protein [Candidatus Nitrosomaritimum aestuariumsis]